MTLNHMTGDQNGRKQVSNITNTSNLIVVNCVKHAPVVTSNYFTVYEEDTSSSVISSLPEVEINPISPEEITDLTQIGSGNTSVVLI